ncbi:MAG: hypothetical protein R2932_02595 [Caldilineaceae bacterium]
MLRGNHLAMFAAAKEKDAAWAFLDFHMEPDNDYLYAQNANYFTARIENYSRPMYEGNYKGASTYSTAPRSISITCRITSPNPSSPATRKAPL